MDYDKLMTAGNENMEAVVSAGKIAAAGFEKVNQEVLAYAKTQMEESMAISREMMGCKDVNDFFGLQSEVSRKMLDSWMAESSKLTEMSLKTLTDAMAPLTDRVNANMETVSKAAN